VATTKAVVQDYFKALQQKAGWEVFLADDMGFTSFASPPKRLSGKGAYLESTKRFFSMVSSVEVRSMIVEGATACALTRYRLQPPRGAAFESDVAEIFTVRDGKIDSFGIYFDASPFPK
jgi:ketosteroid isomerase-like protein